MPFALALGVAFMARFGSCSAGRRPAAGKVVLVDLGLLDVRSFRFGSIAALIVALGEFGLLFTLPLLLQNALGFSALGTGWLIASLAVGTFLVSGMTPQLTARYGGRAVVRSASPPRRSPSRVSRSRSRRASAAGSSRGWLFLYGIGVGMATAQLTSVILAEIPVAESGQASGLQSTFRQLGSALGVAILGTLLITTLGRSHDRPPSRRQALRPAVVAAGDRRGHRIGRCGRSRRCSPSRRPPATATPRPRR